MNIVVLEQNSIGLDIDLTIYKEFGNVTYYGNTVHEVAERIKDADIVIANKARLDEESMKDAPNVKLICEFATGYDNVDCAYAKVKGVVVENTPGQNSNAVAELVFGLLVYAVRNFYNGKSGSELKDKRLGILAFGNVGRNVARIAKGFGMTVSAYDAYCPAEAIEAAGVHACSSVDELFQNNDVVSLHIPATPETINSIDYRTVNQMPKGGILINTARKEVINEAELLKLMAERTDMKYISDIKPDADEDFAKFEGRYYATPKKMGAQTAEANINAGIAAASQINSFFEKGDTKYQVNK